MAQNVRGKAKTSLGSKQKGTEKTLVNIKSDKYISWFRIGLLILLSVVMFYPPFLRGLFFEREQLPTEIFVFIIFICFWVYKGLKKDCRFLQTPIDYAAFGFVIVYLFSILAAVSMRSAVLEWLKYCMYFAVYFMLAELADTYKSRIAVLWVLISSTVLMCFMGIDAAAGQHIVNYINNMYNASQPFFNDLFVEGRIYSTLQYPNALAAYVMAMYFVALGLLITLPKFWMKIISGAACFVFLLTFVFTLSRGAYILLPLVALIFVILLPKGTRAKSVAYAFPTVVVTAVVSVKFQSWIANVAQNSTKMWLSVIIGMFVTGLLAAAISYTIKYVERISWKVFMGISCGIAVLGAAGIVFALNTSTPLILEHSLVQNETPVTIQKSSYLKQGMQYKLLFDVDASMEQDKPNAYSVGIISKSEKDILLDKQQALTSMDGKATNGVEQKQIEFTVPEDSEIININFMNTFQGTKVVFENARIVDIASGNVTKTIKLNYKYIPNTITSRFEDIFAVKSGVQRALFYKDGYKIFKDHWFIGAGGGAWRVLYFSYQSYMYLTTEAHNYIVQLGLETGVLGLIVLLSLILAIVVSQLSEHFMDKEGDKMGKIIQAALLTGILALLIHSFMDFDFSLSAVFLLFWELVALYNAKWKQQIQRSITKALDGEISESNSSRFLKLLQKVTYWPAYTKKLKLNAVIAGIVGALVLVLPVTMVSATAYARLAQTQVKNNMGEAMESMKNAASLDPLNPNYKIDYANMLISKQETIQKNITTANEYIDKAERYAKYDSKLVSLIGAFYFNTGNIEKGLEHFNRMVEIRPLVPEDWHQKISAYRGVVEFYANNKDTKNMIGYIDKALNAITQAKEVNKRNISPFIFRSETSEIIEDLKNLKASANSSKEFILGKTVFYNMGSLDINSDNIPDQWSIDNATETSIEVSEEVMIVENKVSDKVNFIQSRNLTLKPGKAYVIEVEFANAVALKAIPFSITGVSETNEGLKVSGNMYTALVTTPTEFKSNNNVLKLGVLGKYEIKSLKIIEK